MPRPRRNDPLGVSNDPVVTTDPKRLDELRQEYLSRIDYIVANYRFWRDLPLDNRSFNESLARLKRAIGKPNDPNRTEAPIDHRLEILISARARKLAGLGPRDMLGAEHDRFVQQATMEVARNTPPKRGRPRNECLRFHVQGLMALIQEMSGRPVLASREIDYVYAPKLHGIGEIIAVIFRDIDPEVTTTQLVNIVRETRRAYAGKRMRFQDFFPFYGKRISFEQGLPREEASSPLKQFEPTTPIYCP